MKQPMVVCSTDRVGQPEARAGRLRKPFEPMRDTLNVLLLDETNDFAWKVASCLGQVPNTKLHFLAMDPWSKLRFSRYRSSFLLRRGGGNDRAIGAIRDAVRRTGAELVLPIDEPSGRLVSALQGALSQFVAVAPLPEDPGVFDVASDKWLLVDHLAKRGLSCYPPTVLCTADEAFEHALRGLPFPTLLKPRRESGGKGIRLFDGADSLRDYLAEEPGDPTGYVVQSVIKGYDVGCSVLCKEGRILAHTIQRARIPAKQPYASAAVIEFVEDERVLDLVGRLVHALGWSGVANIDLRYDEESGQPKVLEINPRYWTSLLGSLFVGVNFPYLHCLAGLGVPFPRPAYSKERFVVRENFAHLWRAWERREGFALGETMLKYMLADPLPHVVQKTRGAWQAAAGRRSSN